MARLLSVHAHPDDEASKGAPTIARYVADGHQAYLVTATGGEAGDILNPAMDRPEIRDNLPAVRAVELERAVEAIGFDELVWLGYRDSGMAETDANEHPDCFAQADLDEATGRLVAIVRRLQPDVIITYSDDQQGYRHPDHLRVHDISVLAYDRAGDPTWYPEAGPVWQPAKLYYSTWSRARMVAHHERFARLGLESPYDNTWFDRPSHDERITTRVDIAEFYPVRRAALLAHATQVDPDAGFWFGLPDDEAADAYPWEDYILARSTVPTEVPEDDLLAGLEAGAGGVGPAGSVGPAGEVRS
ncbi:MAG: mycothiol conjugate amidase Mca [Acidimicrobiales bacterium]